jgi:hypothetical protein
MNNKVKPALIGGVLLGLLSSIPIVAFANLCCCLWALLGGLLATYLYIKKSPTPVTAADGAVLGVMAGLIGGLISIILGIPINLLIGRPMARMLVDWIASIDPSQAELLRDRVMAAQTLTRTVINVVISAIFLFIFAVLGGLIAVPIFEKRKTTAEPPPPPPMS